MSLKKTLLIAIIFIGVVAYYAWDQKRIAKEETREAAESRLVEPKKEAITEITAQSKGRTLKLQKQDDQWKIAQPIQTRADETAVGSLLDEIDRAKKATPFDPKGKLEDFGLKEPELKAEIKGATVLTKDNGSTSSVNVAQEFELGSDTSAKDEVYAHLPKEQKIFTVPISLMAALTKPANDLRDKRLLPANLNLATSVSLASGGQVFALAKQGKDWALAQPVKGLADESKVGQILREWNNAKAEDFIDTKTLNLAAYGLDKPFLTGMVTVTEKNKPATMTLLIGAPVPKKASMRYAMQQGADYVFTVSETNIKNLQPTLSELRSKKIFSIPEANVGKVAFDVRGVKIALARDSAGQWRFEDDKNVKLDTALINNKITDLVNLQATRFIDNVTTPSATGLEKPNLQLTLASKDGKTTESLITGRKADDGDYVYAQRVGMDDRIGIDWQAPGKFFVSRDDLIDKSMFEFDGGLVQKVEVRENGKKIIFTKDKSGGWTAATEGSKKASQVEGAKMTALIYTVGGLNWARKLDPKYPSDQKLVKAQALENPPREILLYGEDGKELAALGQGNTQDPYVYLRRDRSDYFAVDKMRYASIKNAIDEIVSSLTEQK